MALDLNQLAISTLDRAGGLRRRRWLPRPHWYYKRHGTDVGLGHLTLESDANQTPKRAIYSKTASRNQFKEMGRKSKPRGPLGGG